ncbi:MAG: sulfatase-like hydrolase/transferase [Motiliproteus sp.]
MIRKKPKLRKFEFSILASVFLTLGAAGAAQAAEYVKDAEYAKSYKQHKMAWDKEDTALKQQLADLEEHMGKKPNIIYFMWDDAAYGRVGHPMLSKLTGIDTPNIDKMAREGMTLTRMYSEPSCTPTRVAAMTGRHPVRTGLTQVVFPVHAIGMPSEEVTVAELLKKEGYKTAFYGKYHIGDIDGSYPHQNGYDESLFTIYNQFGSQFFNKDGEDTGATIGFTEAQQDQLYTVDKEFRNPSTIPWAAEAKVGETAKQFNKDYSYEEQLRFVEEVHQRSMDFIKDSAKGDAPFLLNYWWHGPNVAGTHRLGRDSDSSGGGDGDGMEYMDKRLGEMFQLLKDQGIDDNTIVVVMADNGPMLEFFPTMSTFGLYTGGKGAFTEGGVRVPAFIRWPGMIEAGSVAGDIIHVTDLYTTFANLGGAKKHIPTDRVIDGVDQTAMLINGDTKGRRDYVHIYTGPLLAATVKQQFKRHWVGDRPGLAGKGFFDLYRDPKEIQPMMAQFLWAWEPFDSMKARHQLQMTEYPNREVTRGVPFKGIELLAGQERTVQTPYMK